MVGCIFPKPPPPPPSTLCRPTLCKGNICDVSCCLAWEIACPTSGFFFIAAELLYVLNAYTPATVTEGVFVNFAITSLTNIIAAVPTTPYSTMLNWVANVYCALQQITGLPIPPAPQYKTIFENAAIVAFFFGSTPLIMGTKQFPAYLTLNTDFGNSINSLCSSQGRDLPPIFNDFVSYLRDIQKCAQSLNLMGAYGTIPISSGSPPTGSMIPCDTCTLMDYICLTGTIVYDAQLALQRFNAIILLSTTAVDPAVRAQAAAFYTLAGGAAFQMLLATTSAQLVDWWQEQSWPVCFNPQLPRS